MSFFQSSPGFLRNVPPVVKNIIIINVIMLVMTAVARNFMIEHFALFYPGSPFFEPYQYITHMFMHGGIAHLFFNMYAFWLFGSAMESMWGGKKFLFYYFVTGLGAAALHTFVCWIELHHLIDAIEAGNMAAITRYTDILRTPTVGASGAVFGILLAFGMMFPNTVLQLFFPPMAIKAKWFVIGYGLLELFLGVTNGSDNIAHFAHVGGMLFGFFLIKYWQKKGRLYS